MLALSDHFVKANLAHIDIKSSFREKTLRVFGAIESVCFLGVLVSMRQRGV